MTNTTTTPEARIEELRAQLAAAEEAQREQQREEKRQREEQERRQRNRIYRRERGATIRALRPFMVQLQRALETLGHHVELVEGSVDRGNRLPTLKLPYSCVPTFTERRERSCSRFSSGKVVGYNITVGDYGDRKTFPSKKDGSYSIDKIAEEISSRLAAEQRAHQAEQRRRAATGDAKELAAQLGGSVIEGRYDHRGRWVASTPTISLTVEQAQALLAKLNS